MKKNFVISSLVAISFIAFVKAESFDSNADTWNVYKNTSNGRCTCQKPEERPLLGSLLKSGFTSKSAAQDWACNSDDCDTVAGRDCK